MYGSQTGNAQSIAEGVHEGCQSRGLESTLLKCDAWKKVTNLVTLICFLLLLLLLLTVFLKVCFSADFGRLTIRNDAGTVAIVFAVCLCLCFQVLMRTGLHGRAKFFAKLVDDVWFASVSTRWCHASPSLPAPDPSKPFSKENQGPSTRTCVNRAHDGQSSPQFFVSLVRSCLIVSGLVLTCPILTLCLALLFWQNQDEPRAEGVERADTGGVHDRQRRSARELGEVLEVGTCTCTIDAFFFEHAGVCYRRRFVFLSRSEVGGVVGRRREERLVPVGGTAGRSVALPEGGDEGSSNQWLVM